MKIVVCTRLPFFATDGSVNASSLYFNVPVIVTLSSIVILFALSLTLLFIIEPLFIIIIFDTINASLSIVPSNSTLLEVKKRSLFIFASLDNLNDVLTSVQVKINTVYIALNSINVVENEVFETRYLNNIFQNQNGSFSRNLLHHTSLLC